MLIFINIIFNIFHIHSTIINKHCSFRQSKKNIRAYARVGIQPN